MLLSVSFSLLYGLSGVSLRPAPSTAGSVQGWAWSQRVHQWGGHSLLTERASACGGCPPSQPAGLHLEVGSPSRPECSRCPRAKPRAGGRAGQMSGGLFPKLGHQAETQTSAESERGRGARCPCLTSLSLRNRTLSPGGGQDGERGHNTGLGKSSGRPRNTSGSKSHCLGGTTRPAAGVRWEGRNRRGPCAVTPTPPTLAAPFLPTQRPGFSPPKKP